jgi:hypothetical protein
VRWIPRCLNRFEAGWSLERKIDIKPFGMLDLATPGTLYRCRRHYQCLRVRQIVGCICVRVVLTSKAGVALLAEIAGRVVLV